MWSDDAFIRLWDALSGIYGKRFCTEHGEEMNETWKLAVAQISYTQAKHGLDTCLRSKDEFVPTLPQFLYRARSMPPPVTYRLPSPVIDRVVGRQRVKEIIAGAKSTVSRRCILLPGENYTDYRAALHESGIPEPEFKVQRLAVNGWSQQDEVGYRRLAGVIGLRLN